jgi:hypothetical protein
LLRRPDLIDPTLLQLDGAWAVTSGMNNCEGAQEWIKGRIYMRLCLVVRIDC